MHSNRFPEKVLTFSSYDYCYRISLVSLITMLTFKTVLTILFILDFNRMTSIPEKIVIRFMWMITSIFTLAHLGHEITLRQTLGYHHFGRLCFNLYLGKVCLNAYIITNRQYIIFLGKHRRFKSVRNWQNSVHSYTVFGNISFDILGLKMS